MKKIWSALCALSCLAVSAPASAELIYGVAAVGNATSLVSFDSATPGSLAAGVFVSGLQTNETLAGIDFRPATGQLYGLGTSSRLYTINTSTGVATPVAGAFTPALNGFSFGFDFNPMIDRIRVVSETNKNLVLNPITGAVQLAATDLAYSPNVQDPNVVHSAYTNNVPNAASTQLYGIDVGLNILVTQANNAGTLGIVGPLGVNVNAVGGFDISGATCTGIAYAVLTLATPASELYRIDLATGAATSVGQIDGGIIITGLAVAPAVPEPAAGGLAACGLLGLAAVRRRVR